MRSTRLTGDATRFLRLLADYGHADDDLLDRLVLDAADLAEGDVIDVATVRRLAAGDLFPDEPLEPTAPLAEDWPLLFS
jgi:hypothetical protein